MKSLVFLFVLIFSINLYSQLPITYTEVVKVDSVTKNELYNRGKVWFAETYKSSNDVLQMDNKEEGEIIGKATMRYTPKVFISSSQTKGYIDYTIKLFFKEGRYKYEITNFIHEPIGNSYGKISLGLITDEEKCPNPKTMAKEWSNSVWRDIKKQIDENMVKVINSIKQSMSTQTETKNDDW